MKPGIFRNWRRESGMFDTWRKFLGTLAMWFMTSVIAGTGILLAGNLIRWMMK